MMHPQHSPIFLFSSYSRRLVPGFSFFCLPECFFVLFDIRLCGSFNVSHKVEFFSTIIAGDAVKVSSRFLSSFVLPSLSPVFSMMGKHNLVADILVLVLTIIVIITLVV